MAAKLFFYKTDDKVGRRQYPLAVGDNLMMLMDMNSKGLVIDCPQIRGKELEEFTRKFNVLTGNELRASLQIDSDSFMAVLNQCVQCVGCRRRVEHLFYQLTSTGYPTVDPLMLQKTPGNGVLTITEERLRTPQALGTLLYRHHEVLNNLLDSKLRNKTRCMLHSLDTFRSKPFSESWREVWSVMKHNCRDELAVIETKELHDVLENYLKKHKFCNGCRTKIEKAYKLLVGETTTKEKGFVAALYANIKKCHPDKHIHVLTNKVDYLDVLIRRAEPEVNSTYSKQRERHAKTLEIAQEEVITCVGMIMYERLRNVYVSLREEERACQVLAAVGVHALYRSFDMSVERKQGISNLELLYQEIARAEKAKEHKRAQKKLKKKKKKIEKKNLKMCANNEEEDGDAEDDDDYGEEEDEVDEAIDCGGGDVAAAAAEEHVAADETEVGKRQAADVANATDSESGDHAQHSGDEPLAEGAGGANASSAAKTKAKKHKPQKRKQNKSPPAPKKNRKKQPPQPAPSSKQQQRQASSCSETLDDNNNLAARRRGDVNDAARKESPAGKCNDCLSPANSCPCDSDVKDSGYGSEPNCREASRLSSELSSHEGSVVSCSDGCCHDHDATDGAEHEADSDEAEHLYNEFSDGYESFPGGSQLCGPYTNAFTLQQMLHEFDDEDEENCYIPQEVVREYQSHHEWVQQQRRQLRETLKQNFARLCVERSVKPPPEHLVS